MHTHTHRHIHTQTHTQTQTHTHTDTHPQTHRKLGEEGMDGLINSTVLIMSQIYINIVNYHIVQFQYTQFYLPIIF